MKTFSLIWVGRTDCSSTEEHTSVSVRVSLPVRIKDLLIKDYIGTSPKQVEQTKVPKHETGRDAYLWRSRKWERSGLHGLWTATAVDPPSFFLQLPGHRSPITDDKCAQAAQGNYNSNSSGVYLGQPMFSTRPRPSPFPHRNSGMGWRHSGDTPFVSGGGGGRNGDRKHVGRPTHTHTDTLWRPLPILRLGQIRLPPYVNKNIYVKVFFK